MEKILQFNTFYHTITPHNNCDFCKKKSLLGKNLLLSTQKFFKNANCKTKAHKTQLKILTNNNLNSKTKFLNYNRITPLITLQKTRVAIILQLNLFAIL